MTPEEYLSQLIYNSRFGPLAVSRHSELRKATNLFSRAIASEIFGGVLNLGGEDVTGLSGSDPILTSLRDKILPYFPTHCRERIAGAPIGTIHNLDFDGFATPTPEGGVVVCIDVGLTMLLQLNNQCIHSFDPESVRQNDRSGSVFAYAAAKIIHLILGVEGRVLPPLPPKPQRNIRVILMQAIEIYLAQMNFVVAHEVSHICLGHVDAINPLGRPEIKAVRELAADEAAARILLAQERARPQSRNRQDVELSLGAVGAIFYAADAILAVSNRGKPFVRLYPKPEDRFDQAIEVFRQYYGDGIMGVDQYMRPFGLICHVFEMINSDPAEATQWLLEIALACKRVGDDLEELFILSIAREAATMANDRRSKGGIEKYLEQNISKIPGPFVESVLQFRL